MDEKRPKRKAKDSIFTSLFSDRHNILLLYQALHPEDKAAREEDIRNVTLHNVLTDGMYNDLGFLVGKHLIILVEAQSTWSPNIVIRALMYLVKTYNEYFKENKQNIYGTAAIELPRPELYIIYTGKYKKRKKYLSLKEMYFPKGKCAIEVKARIIYDGKQGDIINQYVTFCHVLDKQVSKYGRTKIALEETIRICRDKDVLKEYLEQRRSEMSEYIWDMTDEEIEEMYWKNEIEKAVDRAIKENTQSVTQTVTKTVTQNVTKSVSEELALKFARKLIEGGQLSSADIARYSGLSLKEVEALKESM